MDDVDKRMHCQSCGTVTEDGECDCTRAELTDSQDLKPYVDSIIADIVGLADRERVDGRLEVANALDWCICELSRLRTEKAPAPAESGAVASDDDPYRAHGTDNCFLVDAHPPSVPGAVKEGWRDISTAPTNGKKIMLWWRTCKEPSIGWFEFNEEYVDRKSKYQSPEHGWRNEGDGCIPRNQSDCTHWMPLPASPSPDRPASEEGA